MGMQLKFASLYVTVMYAMDSFAQQSGSYCLLKNLSLKEVGFPAISFIKLDVHLNRADILQSTQARL